MQPLIWTAAERPEAVEDVRAMRRRIIDAVPKSEVDREIKRGPGGLRDIEFAVQLLQLVHGRADETLRSPSTVEALRALTDGGYVGRADGEALLRAYRFLRMRRAPAAAAAAAPHPHRARPTRPSCAGWRTRSGTGRTPSATRSTAFRADWARHAGEVRRLHAKLLYRPLLEAVARVPSEELRLTPEAAGARLEVLGFADPAGALRHIEALTGGVSRTAAIQRTLLPVLLSEFADAPEPDRGLLAYRQVSEKLGSTPVVPAAAARRGAGGAAAGPAAGAVPVRHRPAHPRPGGAAAAGRRRRAGPAYRALPTASAAAAGTPATRSTAIARGAGAAPPRAVPDRERRPARPASTSTPSATRSPTITDATLAGRAGRGEPGRAVASPSSGWAGSAAREMNYPSDADVLFVYEPPAGMAEDARQRRPRTPSPRSCAGCCRCRRPTRRSGVDADLRPEGRQGPLVRSLAAYEQYYARWSKVWEAQALLRARFVAGDAALAARFLALADRVRYPAGGLTREQVTEIRRIKARVDNERLPRGADPATHTKLGRGGLADVEWTVQLLQLRHGHAHAGLRTTRTLDGAAARPPTPGCCPPRTRPRWRRPGGWPPGCATR